MVLTRCCAAMAEYPIHPGRAIGAFTLGETVSHTLRTLRPLNKPLGPLLLAHSEPGACRAALPGPNGP